MISLTQKSYQKIKKTVKYVRDFNGFMLELLRTFSANKGVLFLQALRQASLLLFKQLLYLFCSFKKLFLKILDDFKLKYYLCFSG